MRLRRRQDISVWNCKGDVGAPAVVGASVSSVRALLKVNSKSPITKAIFNGTMCVHPGSCAQLADSVILLAVRAATGGRCVFIEWILAMILRNV